MTNLHKYFYPSSWNQLINVHLQCPESKGQQKVKKTTGLCPSRSYYAMGESLELDLTEIQRRHYNILYSRCPMACWMALKLRNTAHEFWRRFLRLNNFFLLKNMPKVQGKVFQTLSLTGFLFFSAIWWTVCKTKDIFWSWKFVINWLDKNNGNSALRFLSRNPSKDFRNPFTTFFLTYPLKVKDKKMEIYWLLLILQNIIITF